MRVPAPPPLGNLRLASPQDVMRIGVVAVAGFRYSPVFDWERPYHEKYPSDTLISYRREFTSCIKDPRCIVLVAVDKYIPTESEKTKATIPTDNGTTPPTEGEEVVVGVGCWKLERTSKRIGHFQNENGEYPDLPENKNRDQNPSHCRIFGEKMTEAEEKYFRNMSTMEMLVVHPAYWRRGHGTQLCKWGLDLAALDDVAQGVLAAKMGSKLYIDLGYELITDIAISGDEEMPEGVTIQAMKYSGSNTEL